MYPFKFIWICRYRASSPPAKPLAVVVSCPEHSLSVVGFQFCCAHVGTHIHGFVNSCNTRALKMCSGDFIFALVEASFTYCLRRLHCPRDSLSLVSVGERGWRPPGRLGAGHVCAQGLLLASLSAITAPLFLPSSSSF